MVFPHPCVCKECENFTTVNNTSDSNIHKKNSYFVYINLSHDVASGSDIMLFNKIDKPQVVYRFSGNIMTSIITLCKRWQNLDGFTPKNVIFY